MASDETFLVIQLFDSEGYVTCAIGETYAQVIEKARAISHARKKLIACTIPFPGSWYSSDISSRIPDVSLPVDWQAELAGVNKASKE